MREFLGTLDMNPLESGVCKHMGAVANVWPSVQWGVLAQQVLNHESGLGRGGVQSQPNQLLCAP